MFAHPLTGDGTDLSNVCPSPHGRFAHPLTGDVTYLINPRHPRLSAAISLIFIRADSRNSRAILLLPAKTLFCVKKYATKKPLKSTEVSADFRGAY